MRDEWVDRYGPIPEPAEMLLKVAYLRAECHRIGLNDLVITPVQARLAPIDLKVSEEARLRRLSRDSIYKEAVRQLVVPIPRDREPAEFLVGFLRELRPAE